MGYLLDLAGKFMSAGENIYHAESGQGGPCLTDAAQEAALDASFVGGRYAAAQTPAAAILAAYFSGGVIETSGKALHAGSR